MKKKLILILAMVVLLTGVSGTLAYVIDHADEVTNTFEVGNINIDLTETEIDEDGNPGNNYDGVPGEDLFKDPKVTVKGGSEANYLFVKITEVDNTINSTQIIQYALNLESQGFTKYATGTGVEVWYMEVDASDADQSWYILTDNTVTINPDLTKADVDAIETATMKPQLIFDAAAVQKQELTLALAWEQLPDWTDGLVLYTEPAE